MRAKLYLDPDSIPADWPREKYCEYDTRRDYESEDYIRGAGRDRSKVCTRPIGHAGKHTNMATWSTRFDVESTYSGGLKLDIRHNHGWTDANFKSEEELERFISFLRLAWEKRAE